MPDNYPWKRYLNTVAQSDVLRQPTNRVLDVPNSAESSYPVNLRQQPALQQVAVPSSTYVSPKPGGNTIGRYIMGKKCGGGKKK